MQAFFVYFCKKIKENPENLFKHNINATKFKYAFAGCESLTNIPEAIIEFGKKVDDKGGDANKMFAYCISASNYNSLPEYMK